ncbi:Echinoderm microtubule-associated protein-like 5 [Halocaridina rubra]|uniref:Echinoderm microtubule-associated protein-like 5 n=1 Tax=Halocaridina rubra TaxID=373956 RepID=A0AAN8WLC4_HALRR
MEDCTTQNNINQQHNITVWIDYVLPWGLWAIRPGAGEQLFYEAPLGTRHVIPEATSTELAWEPPMTCVLDETVEGIWAPEMDLTDINALATAYTLPVMVSASDDEGLVRLFRWPCKGGFKRHRQYRAHSSHVTNVKWTFDDSLVVSTGGADTSVIVWQVRNNSAAEGDITSPDTDSLELAGRVDDLPLEELTMTDLEAAGLEDEDLLSASQASVNLKTRTRKSASQNSASKRRPNSRVTSAFLRERMRSLPSLTMDDETIYDPPTKNLVLL